MMNKNVKTNIKVYKMKQINMSIVNQIQIKSKLSKRYIDKINKQRTQYMNKYINEYNLSIIYE